MYRDNPIKFRLSSTTTFRKVWKTLSSTGSQSSSVESRLKKSEKVGTAILLIMREGNWLVQRCQPIKSGRSNNLTPAYVVVVSHLYAAGSSTLRVAGVSTPM